jgi:hypothetical protein
MRMRAKPPKGHELDNVNLLLETRAHRRKVLGARDDFLLKVFIRVVEDNTLKEYLWQADAMDPDNGSNDTAILIRWKLEYPYVIGDPQYSGDDERLAALTFCSIMVAVHGTSPGDFQSNVHFAYSGKDGVLSTHVPVLQAGKANKIMAPIWFTPTLLTIYTPNSKT